MFAAAPTWGITGPDFLAGYAGLIAAAGLLVLWRWRDELGPRPRTVDAALGAAQLALLAGGPQLAITATAAKLHRGGHLLAGAQPDMITVGRRLGSRADALDRAVFDAVGLEPGVRTRELRSKLSGCDAIAAISAELTRYELLLAPDAVRRLRRLWLVGLGVAILGAARIYAGVENHAAVGYLTVLVLGVVCATVWLGLRRPWATARGQVLLTRERAAYHRAPAGAELALVVALLGGAALWSAEPALAQTWGVSRVSSGYGGYGGYGGYDGSGSGAGSGGGCGGGGGGGCGGGGGGGCGG